MRSPQGSEGGETSGPRDARAEVLRFKVLLLIDAPRCPRELRERSPGASRKAVETAVRRLARSRLIECATPELLQSRLYRRTFLGRLLAEELGAREAQLPLLTDDELRIYAWIQAGAYRRATLREMDRPYSPRRLRRQVLPYHERFGANHFHAVLREFRDRGVAVRDPLGMWRLTDLGRRMRAIDSSGLPERPRSPGPWMPLPAGPEQKHDPKDEGRNPNKPEKL